MTAHIYLRESTFDQENGLEVQLEQALAYHGAKLASVKLGEPFTDRAVSGSKPFCTRPAGNQLDAILTAGDDVIVTKLDRGFRDTLDFLATERAWHERGIKLHVLDLPILSSDVPEYIADMLRTVLAMFAQFERARIRQRTRDVMRWLKARGLRHCRDAGYGFHWVFSGMKGGKKVYKRRPHERELQIMQWICEQRQTGLSWEKIYFTLLMKRERTRSNKEWSLNRIKRASQVWELLVSTQQIQPGESAATLWPSSENGLAKSESDS